METSDDRVVEERRVVSAAPDIVFTVITAPADITGWLSNEARCEARPGGVYELRWNSGYAVHGTVTALSRPGAFSVAWRGSDEPGPTTVSFALAPAAAGTEVTVRHSGFGPGPEWDRVMAESQRGWGRSLENLEHLVATGVDPRLARRPMLGINFGEPPDADRIAREGIAAPAGVYLAGVMDGFSAQAAGLQAGDVITSVGGVAVPDIMSLVNVLQRRSAGENVAVGFVRGKEQRTVALELKPRPVRDIPADLPALLALVTETYQRERAGVEQAVSGVDEERAGRRPAGGEWSVKEIIAHLSVSERDLHFQLGDVLQGEERSPAAPNPDIVPEKMAAALAAAPTVAALIARLAADQAGTLAMLAALRPEIVANKARYHRIALAVFEWADHVHEHTGQIKSALSAA